MERSPGVYTFDVTDKYVAALQAHSLRWIAIFGPNNPLYDNNTDVHSRAGIAAFAAWAAAVAHRYADQVANGQILCELVNEPNNNGFGKLYSNATLYAQASFSPSPLSLNPTPVPPSSSFTLRPLVSRQLCPEHKS